MEVHSFSSALSISSSFFLFILTMAGIPPGVVPPLFAAAALIIYVIVGVVTFDRECKLSQPSMHSLGDTAATFTSVTPSLAQTG